MRRAAASLVLLLALIVPAVAAAQSSGLKRLTLRQDLLGFEAVGRLELGQTGFCTGVLIATDLVLTAAHCLESVHNGLVPMKDLRFRAGLRDGEVVAERGVKRAVIHENYLFGAGSSIENIRHDVALVQLQQPIAAAIAAWFRVDRLPARNGKVSVVSYARGRAAALSWQGQCNVLGSQQNLAAFDCDVTFGASGAPVFDRSGNRPRIVSLVSSGRKADGTTTSFGMELPAMIDSLKRAMRAGRWVLQ